MFFIIIRYEDGVFILNIGDRKYPLTKSMEKICNENSFYYNRIHDYLSTKDADGEKFFMLCKTKKEFTPIKTEVKQLW